MGQNLEEGHQQCSFVTSYHSVCLSICLTVCLSVFYPSFFLCASQSVSGFWAAAPKGAMPYRIGGFRAYVRTYVRTYDAKQDPVDFGFQLW